VNEYSPINVELELDWQNEKLFEKEKNEEFTEIQENFLDLKHIDKTTSTNIMKPKEKTMMELIEECKQKNSTYETFMNTIKNTGIVQKSETKNLILANSGLQNIASGVSRTQNTGLKKLPVKTYSANFLTKKEQITTTTLNISKKSDKNITKPLLKTENTELKIFREKKREYSRSMHESMQKEKIKTNMASSHSDSDNEEKIQDIQKPLKTERILTKKQNQQITKKSSKKALTYTDLHSKKTNKSTIIKKAYKNTNNAQNIQNDNAEPIVVQIVQDEPNNVTIDLSESEFSQKSGVIKSEISESEIKLSGRIFEPKSKPISPIKNPPKNTKSTMKAASGIINKNKTVSKCGVVPIQTPTSLLNSKLKKGSFSYFQFTKSSTIPMVQKSQIKTLKIQPSLVNTLLVPQPAKINESMQKGPTNKELAKTFAKYRNNKGNIITQAIKIKEHKNKIERLIININSKRSASPDINISNHKIELSQSFDCIFLNFIIILRL